MYLSSRRRHLSSASVREGAPPAGDVARLVSSVTGLEISTSTAVPSHDVALVARSGSVVHVSGSRAVNQTWAASHEYDDRIDAQQGWSPAHVSEHVAIQPLDVA